jgi:hypothetical protein
VFIVGEVSAGAVIWQINAEADAMLTAMPDGGAAVNQGVILNVRPGAAFEHRDMPIGDGLNGRFFHNDCTICFVDGPTARTQFLATGVSVLQPLGARSGVGAEHAQAEGVRMEKCASVILHPFQPHSRVQGSRNVREKFCEQNDIGGEMPEAPGNHLRSIYDGSFSGYYIRRGRTPIEIQSLIRPKNCLNGEGCGRIRRPAPHAEIESRFPDAVKDSALIFDSHMGRRRNVEKSVE